ncbi:MAG: anhydro-N-acetylmuramic acid kinase [Candidatus Zixiibacteriota bacterium]
MSRSREHPLQRIARASNLWILGINSGTSLDGVDLCLLRVSESRGRLARYDVRTTESVRFPKHLRQRLWTAATEDTVKKQSLLQLQMDYTRWVAKSVLRIQQRMGNSGSIHALAFHGQTIAHYPVLKRRRRAGWNGDTTWQIGSGPLLAQETGLITVDDFRSSDIAAGGMGAPLSGYYHYLLFGDSHAILNLGGIANVSIARRRGQRLEVLAFDIGPGNMMIDLVAHRVLGRAFDPGGRTAQRGNPVETILARWRTHAYFRRTPPKTCGREEFGATAMRQWFGRLPNRRNSAADALATAVQGTAEQIGRAFTRWVEPFSPVRSLLLTGGGVRNAALVNALKGQLINWDVSDTSLAGVDPRFVEPAGFAVLAHETLRGRPGNLGGATGGSPAILGSISLP